MWCWCGAATARCVPLRSGAVVDEETGDALWYIDVPQMAEDGVTPLKDANGDPIVKKETTNTFTNATQYATGDILPKAYGGFGTNLSAYGFDFGISFAYQFGGRIYDNTYAALMHQGTSDDAGQNWHSDILNAWTPENKVTEVPKLNYNGDGYANAVSTRFLTSSDYLSINNITFGYTVPKRVTQKIGVQTFRVYCAADNVAVFSARKGLDPRQSYSTSSNSYYSPMRTASVGVMMTF